jgi:hypothetical protein
MALALSLALAHPPPSARRCLATSAHTPPRPPTASSSAASTAGPSAAPTASEVQLELQRRAPPGGTTFSLALAALSADPRLPPSLLQHLVSLPSVVAGGPPALAASSAGLLAWRDSFERGLLPSAEAAWPEDAVFRRAVVDSLAALDMPRFTRRHPRLVGTLLGNLVAALGRYEANRVAPPLEQEGAGSGQGEGGKSGKDGAAQGEGGGEGQESESDSNPAQQGSGSRGGAGKGRTAEEADALASGFDFSITPQPGGSRPAQAAAAAAAAAANAELARKIAQEVSEAWAPVTEKLEAATSLFPDFDLGHLSPDRSAGFDFSTPAWRAAGWRELASITRKLAGLKELRSLIRSLGRASGTPRSPLRRAPQHAPVSHKVSTTGLLRSPRAPEETAGLSRSGDISRMLPAELALLARNKAMDHARANVRTRYDQTKPKSSESNQTKSNQSISNHYLSRPVTNN